MHTILEHSHAHVTSLSIKEARMFLQLVYNLKIAFWMEQTVEVKFLWYFARLYICLVCMSLSTLLYFACVCVCEPRFLFRRRQTRLRICIMFMTNYQPFSHQKLGKFVGNFFFTLHICLESWVVTSQRTSWRTSLMNLANLVKVNG